MLFFFSKIPFANSSLNELIAVNKKESNLMGPTKAACKGSPGFWYSNEEEEMEPQILKIMVLSPSRTKHFNSLTLWATKTNVRSKEKKDQTESPLFKQWLMNSRNSRTTRNSTLKEKSHSKMLGLPS